MATEVCEHCGRLFSSTGRKLCPDCLEETRKIEDTLYDYLDKENRLVTMEQLHQATGVPLPIILDMYKHGQFLHRYKVAAECDLCHEPIFQGKICGMCAGKMQGDLSNKPDEPKSEEKKPSGNKGSARGRFHSR